MAPVSREISDQALAWVTRLNSGRADLAVRRDAAAWRAADPTHEAAFHEADMLWRMASELAEDTGGLVRPAAIRPRNPVLAPLTALAASLLLLLAGALWQGGWPPAALADFATRSEIATMALEDGSTLSLDARTAADAAFTASARRIRLHRGAVFAQVAPAPHRPFTVEAGAIRVTALGTAFEVARDGGGGVRVAVAEHSVTVSGPAGLEMIVREGESVRVEENGSALPIRATADIAAWRGNRLVAEEESLGHVVAALSAHSHGWIVVSDRHLAALKVNAVLDLDDTEGSLAALQAALPISIRRIGGVVTVLSGSQ